MSLKNNVYIDELTELKAFVDEAVCAPVVAVDTEFIRERSFYPQLCLLQIATPERAVIVDPIMLIDLSPLRSIFSSPDIVKVFHAGDQDLEIIYHNLGMVPTPLFDTQRAAELLGLAQQTSLSGLVREFAGVRLTKTDSFTNWNTRPLTTSQINYALDDVRYLPQIYLQMYARLSELGRVSWLEEEFATMADEQRYVIRPEAAWRKVKHSSSLNSRQLGVLMEVAATRERIAMKRNLPRKWIVADELMVEIARLSPETIEELYHLRGAESQLGHHWSRDILAAVKRGLELPVKEIPERSHPMFRTATNAASLDILRVLVNQRARENRVTPSMLTNKNELVRLANGEREGLEVLSGWRRKLVGAELLDLLEGRLSLRLNGDDIEVTPLETTQT